jgi:predicted dienelactone hydrolase
MKYTLPITTLTVLAISTASLFADEYQTGMSELEVRDTVGDRHLDGIIWYPTDKTDGAVRAQGNAVWKPITVHPNAEAAAGKHPLVLLSHGMYGNHRNQAWLAALLTQQGYIVAAIDHPGTSTFKRDPDHARELWERPRDISRTIDHILAEPAYAKHVDAENIFMAGHSLGGFTAVALAGGRFDPVKFDTFCASADADLACGVIAKWNVAKSDADRITIARDMSDDRIKGFAVFDLGGTQSFSTPSLGAINTPMLVIGAPENVHGLNLDVESRALNAALPPQTTQYLEPAGLSHFDFMGECTENGLAILKEEEPDDVYVCEKGTEERAGEHREIAVAVIDFFFGL